MLLGFFPTKVGREGVPLSDPAEEEEGEEEKDEVVYVEEDFFKEAEDDRGEGTGDQAP
jgi:hypothetical protein